MIPNSHEIIYFNEGEICDIPALSRLRANCVVTKDLHTNGLFPRVEVDGKKYFITDNFKQLFDIHDGLVLSGFNLCPDVTLWLCLGAAFETERRDYSLYFAFDSTEQLQKIATYYALPFPATPAICQAIEASPESFSIMTAPNRPIVFCGLKYIKGRPSSLKLYTYPKDPEGWQTGMSGVAYYKGGTCFESGSVYRRKANEVVHSTREDGTQIIYEETRQKDPILSWQGREIDSTGNTIRIKQYESSRYLCGIVGGMTDGPEYKEFDLCGDVEFWLGRSWYADDAEQELLFAVTGGSAQLDAVADYYKLPFPCNEAQRIILDTTPEVYRVRHLDMYKLGLGKYAPVIAASITFSAGLPTRLLLYTRLRQWDFTEPLVPPNPAGVVLAQTYLAGCLPIDIEESGP